MAEACRGAALKAERRAKDIMGYFGKDEFCASAVNHLIRLWQ